MQCFSFCSLSQFTILLKKPSTTEVEEMAFNSEGKHKIPKLAPDTAVRG